MEKRMKPYGKVYSQGKEYYLLEPHQRAISDGTFEFLVVPYWHPEKVTFIRWPTPRFINVTEFLSEHSDEPEITITVSELEE